MGGKENGSTDKEDLQKLNGAQEETEVAETQSNARRKKVKMDSQILLEEYQNSCLVFCH